MNETLMLDLNVVSHLHAFLDVEAAVNRINETITRGGKISNTPAMVLTQPVSERFLRRMGSSNLAAGSSTQPRRVNSDRPL